MKREPKDYRKEWSLLAARRPDDVQLLLAVQSGNEILSAYERLLTDFLTLKIENMQLKRVLDPIEELLEEPSD